MLPREGVRQTLELDVSGIKTVILATTIVFFFVCKRDEGRRLQFGRKFSLSSTSGMVELAAFFRYVRDSPNMKNELW